MEIKVVIKPTSKGGYQPKGGTPPKNPKPPTGGSNINKYGS
jgi:hypothetical protein